MQLKGITWDHLRGYGPLEATATEYGRQHAEVEITWERRSLQAFADHPIDDLASRYDLLMIDHPWVGTAAATGCIVALDRFLPASFLEEQRAHSVGPSYASYEYCGHLWALAADAAAQVAALRADLLESPPSTWDEVIALARRTADSSCGRVAIPLIPVDAFCTFMTLYANRDRPAFEDDRPVAGETGMAVLELMRELAAHSHPSSLELNPFRTLDLMSMSDEVAYVPLLFGYSNYARDGYRPHLVTFTDIPSSGHGPVGSILGGVGIAVSSRSADPEIALDYSRYVVSPDIQRSIYVQAGGQPGNSVAWEDDGANDLTHGFFRATRATLEGCHVRPRHHGFLRVQDEGGLVIHEFLREGGEGAAVLRKLDQIYDESRRSS